MLYMQCYYGYVHFHNRSFKQQSKSVQVSPTWHWFSYGELSEPASHSPLPLTFFAGDFQLDNNESPGCAHLIPSGRGEKHHSALGILCLKMVICQLEQILGEPGRWRVDRFHLLYLLNLITGTGLQRGKNILPRIIWKEVGEYGGDPSKTASQSFSQSDVRHLSVHNLLYFLWCRFHTSQTENTLFKGLTFGSLIFFAVFFSVPNL